jgi:hypothetical protein
MKHLTPEELVDSLDRALPAARQAHVDDCARCQTERATLSAVVRDVAAVEMPEPSPLFWDHLSARVRARVEEEPAPSAHAPAWGSSDEAALDPIGSGWFDGLWPRWTVRDTFAAVAVLALCATAGWVGWTQLDADRQPYRNLPASVVASGVNIGAGDMGARESDADPDADGDASATPAIASGAPDAADGSGANATSVTSLASASDVPDAEWTLMVRMAEDVTWDEAESLSNEVRPAAVDRALIELSSDERRTLVKLLHAELSRPPS